VYAVHVYVCVCVCASVVVCTASTWPDIIIIVLNNLQQIIKASFIIYTQYVCVCVCVSLCVWYFAVLLII